MEKRVSVIVTTHNRPKCVKRAVESVLHQTYRNFEILVIDDTGNARGTVEEISRNTKASIRYRQIPQTPYIAESRNAGIRDATGEYIAFLDDDDYWYPEKLETQVDIFEENPDIGLVCGNIYKVNSEKETPRFLLFPQFTRVMKGRLFFEMLTDCFCPVSTLAVRRTVLDAVVNFTVSDRLEHSEDVEFLCRCALVTGCYFDPRAHAVYLDHGTPADRTYPSHTVVLERDIDRERPDYYALSRKYHLWSVGRFAREHKIPLSFLEGYFLYFYLPFFWDLEQAKVYLKSSGRVRGLGHFLGSLVRNPVYVSSIPLYLYFIIKSRLKYHRQETV